MDIIVNGRPLRLEAETALDRFLAERGIAEGSVVERNGEIIQKERRRLVILREGDVLEIARLVGGG